MSCKWSPHRPGMVGVGMLAVWLGLLAFAGAQAPRLKAPSPAVPRVSVGTGAGPSYVPGTWGSLQLQVSNPRSEPVELLCLTYLDHDKSLQFGRRLWLPPQARLRTVQPLRVPQTPDPKKASVEYHTLLSEIGAGEEVFLPDRGGRMVRDGAMSLGVRTKVTGFIDTKEQSAEGEASASAVYEMLLAARSQSTLTFRTSFLYESPLPLYGEESLEAMDCLVIADDRILGEASALAAVRRWLFGGGRLWILMDQVDSQVLEGLLGDDFECQVVDRVGLTHVQIDAGPAGARVESEPAEYEQPVEFVRVVASDIDVMYTVQGWPAAMLKSCGDGQLLITTLGPSGWLRPSASRERGPPGGAPAALSPPPPANSLQASMALRNLAADFFAEPKAPLLPAAALEPVAREYIGYSIPSAWMVVGLLGVFNLLLAGAGVAFGRFGRLDRMGYVVPGIALAISAVLILIGRAHRQGIPPTVVQLQMVQTIPGTDDQRVSGVAGLFSQSTLPAPLGGTHGGWIELALPEGESSTRRLVWTDEGTWHWENMKQLAGLQFASFQSSSSASPRVEAIATLGPEGLTGSLISHGSASAEDVMVATGHGRIAVDLDKNGAFAANAIGVMSNGQYLAANLLSDEQNRRQRVLTQLLGPQGRADFPSRPHLLYWTTNWDTGIDFGSQLRPIGSTLVAVPIRLMRPAAGTKVIVPSPLVSYRTVDGPDGTSATGLYDYRQRRWLERSRPSSAWLRFQVPPLLLPFESTEARVAVEVTGPVKRLEIAAFQDGKVVPLQTWNSPVGALSTRLSDPQFLQLAADGSLLLHVAGGGTLESDASDSEAGAGRASYWQIESLRLDLYGRVLDADRAGSTEPQSVP